MTTLTSLALAADAQDLLFREAQTANTFTDEPVGDDVIEAIYELVKYAPSSMNTQPLRVLFLRSDDAKDRLLKHMGGKNRDKTAAAPLVAVLAADTSFHNDLPRTFPHFPGARDMFADDASRERGGTLQRDAADRLLPARCPGGGSGCWSDGGLRRGRARRGSSGRHHAALAAGRQHRAPRAGRLVRPVATSRDRRGRTHPLTLPGRIASRSHAT